MPNHRLARRRKRLASPQTRWPGLLIGAQQICDYLTVTRHTLQRWHKLYQLPYAHLPDGSLFSSTAIIDDWLAQAITAEMATPYDRTGWTSYQYGCHSGLRLAHDPDGHRLADDLANKRTR